MYLTKVINDEHYCICATYEEFEKFCIDGFWTSTEDFTKDTGIVFEDIQNKWFQVVHNRVYLLENN